MVVTWLKKNQVVEIKDFITKNDILRLPDPDQCKIIEMPEFQRGNSVAFLNPAPPLDPKAARLELMPTAPTIRAVISVPLT